MERIAIAATGLAALLVGGSAALAQNFNLPPAYGSVQITNGFADDPHRLQMQAGGNISAQNLSANCWGYIADAPDYRVNYNAGSHWPLNFYVTSNADTTLIVNGPDGRWYCNDDFQGLNPAVGFPAPQSGQYDVWVGTYSQGALQSATLHVSELAPFAAASSQHPAGGPDYSLPPAYGSVQLTNGFVNDPHTLQMQAGGSLYAGDLGVQCRGYIARAPDYRVQYSAGGSWPLNFYVTSNADTTLLVNGPDGRWHCNDDYQGLDPAVLFTNPQSGQYDIWVGTYSQGALQSATLHVSELAPFGASQLQQSGGAGMPDYNLPPLYGSLSLTSGFPNDPQTLMMQAGGGIDARTVDPSCRGFIAQAPDYSVNYQAGSTWPLNFYVRSQADTTLVINDPYGQWRCNDDYDGLNPAVMFPNPQSGRYDIWVGIYSSSAGYPEATLFTTELAPFQR